MAAPLPGTTEAGLLGFALAEALGDLLVKRGILTRDDINGMYRDLATRLQQTKQHVPQHAAGFIRDSILGTKSIE
jgi:hypothetical protein